MSFVSLKRGLTESDIMKPATRSKNTPIFYSKVFEFDVTCEHCHKKEVLKTTLPLQKIVKNRCSECGKVYSVDISKLKYAKASGLVEGEVA